MSSSNENLGPDPSMEEILSSIRRILREEEHGASAGPAAADHLEMRPEARSENGWEDRAPRAVQTEDDDAGDAAGEEGEDGDNTLLVLDPSMLVPEAPPKAAPKPVPLQAPSRESRPAQAEAPAKGMDDIGAFATSYPGIARTAPPDPAMVVARGGPTLDELVREELRPLLRAWLDAHMPPLVERVVRAEIARLIDQTKS